MAAEFLFHRIQHGMVDSTSERAFESLRQGCARHGDVHLALGQQAGRGRRGRTWVSPAGEGLYLSVVLLPDRALAPPALTLAGGLAVYDAVRSFGVGEARLRWPNDLLLGKAKLAGVLVETRGLDLARPHYVMGIGLNVAQRGFPGDLRSEREVTSLALSGAAVSVQDAERAVLVRLEERLLQAALDPESLSRDFVLATGLGGRWVMVETGVGNFEGEWTDFSLDSGLTLRGPDGSRKNVAVELARHLDPA